MVARLLLVLVSAAPLVAQGGPPGPPSQSAAGTLILTNARFDRVQVEVRLGSSANCAASKSSATHTLRRGQQWAVASARVICWRREAVPGNPSRGWGAWTTAQVAAASTREVDL